MRARAVTTLLMAALATAPAGRDVVSGDHSVLKRIASPQELLFPHLPGSYSVGVALSGSVAGEMARTVKTFGLPEPQYEEVFDKRKASFRLLLANGDCPAQTRDLIAGILNPVEMMEGVVRGLLKYRDEKAFALLSTETTITVERTAVSGRSAWRIVLRPKGERFAYAFEDAGAYVRETWLSGISLEVDSALFLLRSMSCRRHSRTRGADESAASPPESSLQVFTVAYDSTLGAVLPSRLDVTTNARQTISIAATYRALGNRIVFASREITAAGEDGQREDLTMSYQQYRLGARGTIRKTSPGYANRIRAMIVAADLSRRASAQIQTGDLDGAVKTLRSLARDYPGTPQAVAARELLSALPRR